jgi:ATP adenylyltransferase
VDLLWSPWRYDYVKADESEIRRSTSGCVFCDILSNSASDGEKFILHRAEFNFVILNIYPYISGHLMVIPYSHLAEIVDANKQITDELMDLTKLSQSILKEVYNPNGFNVGMNLGKAAGAGVAEHFHMHVLPRWIGDSNFMTAIGQTRTMPESLDSTFEKLKPKFS